MPDLSIGDLTPFAGTPVGTEEFPANVGGLDRKITVQQILDALGGGLQEIIDDRVADLLIAGTNITLSYNDATGELVVDSGGTSDHNLLTNLDDDDHPQYFNELRGDVRYQRSSTLQATVNPIINDLLVAGTNVTLSYDGLAGTLVIEAAGSVSSVNVTGSGAGLTVTGAEVTSSGAFAIALANDTAAIEALEGTGVPYRLDTDVWEMRELPEAYVPPVVVRPWNIDIGDETTPITLGVKYTNRAAFGFTLVDIRASLTTAQATGTIFTVDLLVNGVSVLSTLLTFDNTETSSFAATVPVVIDTPTVADDDQLEVEVTQIGDGTAAGLKLTLLYTPDE